MGAFLLGIIFGVGLLFWKKEKARDPLVRRLKYGSAEMIRRTAIEMNQLRDLRRLQIIAEDYGLIFKLWEKKRDQETSDHLWTLLHRLQHLNNKDGCLCKIYPLDSYSDPKIEDKKAEIKILKLVNYYENKNYWLCRCRLCEEKYLVIDGFWGKWGWESRWCWKNISNEHFENINKIQLTMDDVTDIYEYGQIDEVIARCQSAA